MRISTSPGGGDYSSPPFAHALTTKNQRNDYETETLLPMRRGGFFDDAVAHTLRGEGFDASEDGTGRGTPLVPVAFDTTQITSPENRCNPKPGDPCHPLSAGAHPPAICFNWQAAGNQTTLGANVEHAATLSKSTTQAVAFSCKDHGADVGDEVSPTLRSMGHKDSHQNGGGQVAVAFNLRGRDGGAQVEECEAASLRAASGGSSRSYVATLGVRRLTPRECERLQGWPDDHTRWRLNVKRSGNTWRIVSKAAVEQADGPRYKQAGNGITGTVSAWIARRIARFSAEHALRSVDMPSLNAGARGARD